MDEAIKITDESGDKNWFSIIPHYIVNHSTHWEKSLYLTMKRVTGEKGSCWMSPAKLGKLEKCSANKIRETLNNLEKRKWIRKIGQKGKTKPTNEYVIVDLWHLNNEFYKKKESSSGEQSKRKFTRCTKKVHPVNLESSPRGNKEEYVKKNTKEDTVGKKPTTPKYKKYDDPTVMELKEFVEWCRKSSQRHIQIIAEYADEKKLEFGTKGQWNSFIDRNLRAALLHHSTN